MKCGHVDCQYALPCPLHTSIVGAVEPTRPLPPPPARPSATDKKVKQIRKQFSSQLLCRCPELLDDPPPTANWSAPRAPETLKEDIVSVTDSPEMAEYGQPACLCPPTQAEQIGNLQARVSKLEGEMKELLDGDWLQRAFNDFERQQRLKRNALGINPLCQAR